MIIWPWQKKSRTDSRPVFALEDDDGIARLRHADADDVFDDIFSGRDLASEQAGTYVGNVLTYARVRLGLFVMFTAMAVFLSRIFLWQIIQGDEHRALADANRTSTVILPADRGVIKDRSGIVLAWNEPSFRLIATPRELPEGADARNELFIRAAGVLNEEETVTWIAELTAGKDDAAVLLAEDIGYDEALSFMTQEAEFPGLRVELGARRAYVTNDIPTLSHVLGYTGPISDAEYTVVREDGYRRFDDVGKQGIEKTYEALLRGKPGEEVREVDSEGVAIRTLSRN
ncbi:MAG: hypothetical protein NUV56_01270, partial [Candidatus Uhrbacteria bacterium]|nr:hypothetical protein [Candidatus Uhrbacteria bacterium]